MSSVPRNVLVLAFAIAGCHSSDSVFARQNLPQSIEFGGDDFQSYLATVVFPVGAKTFGDKAFGGRFRVPGLEVEIIPVDADGKRSYCDARESVVRDVKRMVLPDGNIVSCRQANGIAVVREIRIDDGKLICEIVTEDAASDTDLVIATNMCKSLRPSWHADNDPRRFRFPCHGELTFGKNSAGEGTWLTHLDCPPESQGIR